MPCYLTAPSAYLIPFRWSLIKHWRRYFIIPSCVWFCVFSSLGSSVHCLCQWPTAGSCVDFETSKPHFFPAPLGQMFILSHLIQSFFFSSLLVLKILDENCFGKNKRSLWAIHRYGIQKQNLWKNALKKLKKILTVGFSQIEILV